MPTFDDPLADATEASSALRGLAFATRWFDQPADTYRYAGAVPLDRLKREQDRISASLHTITIRIDAHHDDEYADARAHLDDALNLLEHCADIYARCDNANRRLCNQAFFGSIYTDEDNDLRVGYARPFDQLCDPQMQADARTWAEDTRNANKARTPTGVVPVVAGSNLERLG